MKTCFCLAGLIVAQLACVAAAQGDKEEIWVQIKQHFTPPAEYAQADPQYRSPLQFDDGGIVRSKSDWEKRRQEIKTKWMELMGPWPPLLEKPRLEIIEENKRETFVERRVRLEIASNHFEVAYLLLPQQALTNSPARKFPAVLIPYYEPESSIGKKAEFRDFGYQLTKRGFVTLSIGSPGGSAREPDRAGTRCQPLSFLAYVAANCANALASLAEVDPQRIGVVGHSYGGKWAMFASCLSEKFACAAWSDGGIVFDEKRPNVNYWEPWYLGWEPGITRKPGVVTVENPRTGAYKKMIEQGLDLHELHALMAPRPFLVSGGSEDSPSRWKALAHTIEVNRLLGFDQRVAMTNRREHTPNAESNEQIYLFFEYFLK